MAKRKNSYRVSFTIDGAQRDLFVHTQAERNSVKLHVKRLISSKRTGAPCLESEEWAAKLPKNSNVKEFLIRWGLLEDNSDRERTLNDLFEHFQKRGVKASTLETYSHAFGNLFDFFGADRLLRDITPKDATDFELFLRTAARRMNGQNENELAGSGLGKATVKKRIQRVRQFFLEARRLKWVDENPFEVVHGGNIPNPDRWLYLSRDVVLDVMNKAPNLEIRALIALCRFAGARGKSEFNSLEWNSDWIRWSEEGKQGTIRLHRQKTENSGFADTVVPMVPELEGALRDLFDKADPGTVKVFTPRNNPGKVIKDQFIRNGIDVISPYNLRRSYCRDLMEKGLDPKSYEYFAGHSLSVALKHYQSWDDLRAQKAAPKVLEALTDSEQDEKATTYFTTYQQRTLQRSNNSKYLADVNSNIDLSLKNKGFYEQKKALTNNCKGEKLGNRDLNDPSQSPKKQGLLSDGDNSTTCFTTYPDYFKQIIDLFDRLTQDEQQRLISTLISLATSRAVYQNE